MKEDVGFSKVLHQGVQSHLVALDVSVLSVHGRRLPGDLQLGGGGRLDGYLLRGGGGHCRREWVGLDRVFTSLREFRASKHRTRSR